MGDSPYSAGPLSLPIRMEAKKKKRRVGIVFTVIGVVLTGVGIFGFATSGALILGIWGLGMGLILGAVGITMLMKAAKAR